MTKRPVDQRQNVLARIRLISEEDLAITLGWRNKPQIRKWFFHSGVISAEQHGQWFLKYQEKDDDFVFIIESIEMGFRPVGQISIYNINWEKNSGEFGRLMIGEEDAKGKGLARAATNLVLRIAFEELNLDEVYLEVFSENKSAIAVYLESGFVETGRRDNIIVMKIRNTSS